MFAWARQLVPRLRRVEVLASHNLSLSGDANMADLSQYAGQYSPQVLAAVEALFRARPDQEQSLTNNFNGDLAAFLQATQDFWREKGADTANKDTQWAPEMNLLAAIDANPIAQAATTAVANANGAPAAATPTTATTATTAPGAVDLSRWASQYPPQVLAAAQSILAAKPEQIAQNTGPDGQFNLPGFIEGTSGWWSENGGQVADKLDQFVPELQLLHALGFQLNPAVVPASAVPAGVPADIIAPASTTTPTTATTGTPGAITPVTNQPANVTLDPNGVPIEQALFQQIVPRLVGDINADAGRATIADNLANTAIQGSQGAAAIFNRTQGGHFDSNTYFQQNPDVKAAFDAQHAANPNLTADQFAEQHYLNYGQREGRQPAYIQSAQLAQDFNNANQTVAANIAAANQAAQTNLAALATATAAMRQNLTGDLAARASALQQQIDSLTQNLNQLDATQRQALTTQVASMQADLEQSITTQRQALTDQINALGTAATTEASARRASLQQELDGLNAAQAPLAEARMRAGELQATAVNVGLQRTQDQLTADAARAGYVGGSTVQDAAMARASIDARQRAAEAISGARVANAGDTRDIAVRGATGQRSIADALAASQREIAGQSATGNAALTGALAQGRQQIGNFSSAGTAGITNNTAVARAGIGAQGANQTFQDQVFGSQQQRAIADALAQGNLSVTANQANQTQQAQNQGTAARATYYDNDYNRSLNAALGLTAIPTNLTATLTGLDNYANSGTNRALNTLNWWSSNTGAAPTPGYTPVTAPTTGNGISSVGNGLFQLGTSVGAANNWWQTPTTTPRTTTPGGVNAGGSNLYTSPLT
jgi:hypothetical protein